jgi:hypothetical protein
VTILYLLNPDGSDANEANIPDAVWNDPASQAQILAWATQRGFTAYAESGTDPSYQTLLNLRPQIQTWILYEPSASATAPVLATTTPTTTTPATTPATAPLNPWLIGLLAAGVLGGGVLAVYLLTKPSARANPALERTSCGGPRGHVEHVGGCRPGRPKCRYRRREKGICSCTAYHFPHREGSGACRHGVPDAIRKSRSYRGEWGEPRARRS